MATRSVNATLTSESSTAAGRQIKRPMGMNSSMRAIAVRMNGMAGIQRPNDAVTSRDCRRVATVLAGTVHRFTSEQGATTVGGIASQSWRTTLVQTRKLAAKFKQEARKIEHYRLEVRHG